MTGPPPAPPPQGQGSRLLEIGGRVRQLAAEVEALAPSRGRTPAAPGPLAVLERPLRRPTVVVAGESGRGKSRLVNALLERPGLLPVQDEGGTGTPIVVSRADSPMALAHLAAPSEPVTITVEQIADWASIDANAGNARGVRWVEVGIDSPVLTRVRLVDTPGVGGLDQGHAVLTLEALREADALVFVLDSGAPISAPELRFLQQAAERIERVILVLARTDLHRGWEAVMRDDAALLAANAARLSAVPFVAVSSLLAERALSLPAGPQRDALGEESGLDRVRAHLDRIGARPRVVQLLNAIRTCEAEIAMSEDAMVRDIASSGADPALRSAFEAEQARLRDLTHDGAGWRSLLDTEFRRIGLEHTEHLRQGLGEIQRRFTEAALRARGRREIEALPAAVAAEVAALASAVAHGARDRIEAMATRIVAELEAPPDLLDAVRRAAAAELQAPEATPLPPPHAATSADRLTLLVSFAEGHSLILGLPAIGVALGAAPLAVVSIGLGAAFSFVMSRGRADTEMRGEFRAWLGQQVGAAGTHLSTEVARQLVELQTQMHGAVLARIEQTQSGITAEITRLRRAMEEDTATRRRRATVAETHLPGLRGLRARCDVLRGQVAALSASRPAMAPPTDGAPA